MRRGEVWIRGTDAQGQKWGPIDVLDLDDESFRVWVVDMLRRMGCIVTLKSSDEKQICLRAKEGVVVD